MSGLPLIGSTREWFGGPFSERLRCILAPNPSPMTLDGTNTWLIGEAEGPLIVVDPGPDIDEHVTAVQEAGPIAQILLTHGHPDHAEGARSLHEATGAPVRALDPAQVLGGEGLCAGDVVSLGHVEVHVVGTPGHTGDCLSFSVPQDGAILTGDTVLGRGTTVVAWPDGNLGDYLASLVDLRTHAQEVGARAILPGHGPVLDDPVAVIGAYLEHRRARLDQVREVWSGGCRTPEQIVDVVYADVPESVKWAALLSTRAQVEYLESGG